jgi:membrane protein implicated in regulation of membrane protease activity
LRVRTLRPSRTFLRYVGLEAPGWGLAGVVLWLVVEHAGLEPWIAAALLALWIGKDFALYPWLRDAYEAGDPDPTASLVGRVATTRDRLAPSGWVRLGAELWRAELAPGCQPVDPGATVRVHAVRGFTLVVEPGPGEIP